MKRHEHGVDETTATLPAGWQDRLVPIRNENTGGATGWCLEVHDLAISKLVAGREKDLDFIRILLTHGMVKGERLKDLISALAVSAGARQVAAERLSRIVGTP